VSALTTNRISRQQLIQVLLHLQFTSTFKGNLKNKSAQGMLLDTSYSVLRVPTHQWFNVIYSYTLTF